MSEPAKYGESAIEVDAIGIPDDPAALGAAVVVVRRPSSSQVPAAPEVLEWLRSPGRLSIGVVEGDCRAHELTAILACDLILMSKDASISASSPTQDPLPGAGILELLVARVGAPQSLLIWLEPQPLQAHRAREIGLVDDVLPREDLEARVMALADQAARHPEGWVSEMKALLAAATGPTMERGGQERLRRLERDAGVRLKRQHDGLAD